MYLLLVEDNLRLAALIAESMTAEGWEIEVAPTLREAHDSTAVRRHDVLVVDLGLPDGDGMTLIKTMRRRHENVPILILSARTSVEDRVDGLDCGADDYLTKPFRNEELIARCRSVVRRDRNQKTLPLSLGNLHYDPAARIFTVGGQTVTLATHASQILEVLLSDAGRAVPRQRFIGTLSPHADEISVNALEQEMSRLRKKLAAAGASCIIETVRGIGYMLRTKQS